MKHQAHATRPAALLCAAALLLSLAGCGAGSGGSPNFTADAAAPAAAAEEGWAASSTASMDMSAGEAAPEPQADLLDTPTEAGDPLPTARKIVYNAWLELESTDFDAAQAALVQAVEEAGGYLQSSSQSGSAERQTRWADYTARIPVDHYRAFLSLAGNIANVVSQGEDAQDITSSYIDVEARLTALKNQRDRLNELADKAETTADLLEIESQLSEVQYQLESYTRQIRAMDDQVSYSTVNMTLAEVAVLTPVDDSFATRISRAFADGWRDFGSNCQGFAVAAVYLMPMLLLIAAIVALLTAVLRRRRARRAARHAQAAHPAAAPEPPRDPGSEH